MSRLNSEAGIPKYTHKIVLLGDEGVGKTSIINRFASNKFNPDENVKSSLMSVYGGSRLFWQKSGAWG